MSIQEEIEARPYLSLSSVIKILDDHGIPDDEMIDFFVLYGRKGPYKTVDVREWLGY